MTDFLAFFRTGGSVMENSNYEVMRASGDLTTSSLGRNIGYYFVLGYVGSYFLLLIVFNAVDRAKLRRAKFYDSLLALIHGISL